MNIEEKLGYLLEVEFVVLIAVLTSLAFVEYSSTWLNRIWEIIPALITVMITTYGLRKMKSLT